MAVFAFIDIEVANNQIAEIACFTDDEKVYQGSSIHEAVQLMQTASFYVGHNIISHDLKYLTLALPHVVFREEQMIDTLFLSPLLFPKKPYHKLVKDDKLLENEPNDPGRDARRAADLWYDEQSVFCQLPINLQHIYAQLLSKQPGFQGFFKYMKVTTNDLDLIEIIHQEFEGLICQNALMSDFIEQDPTAFAYALSLIHTKDRYSITPPWVMLKFPLVNPIIHALRNQPCITECDYCAKNLDVRKALKKFFLYDAFRDYNGKNLQEDAAKAAVKGESLLAVFPTGGGKSIAFQVPALMSGRNEKGLTVVISPLQSLMKDQVDNLNKINITEAVALNGLLNPMERSDVIQRVEDGNASLLYISPESLRSSTIVRLLTKRHISRFVIDEAHCFSSWGQDFRVDYLNIGPFIKKLQKLKGLREAIPVSCFTATAKVEVIRDIETYFKTHLNLDLRSFIASSKRENLEFRVVDNSSESDKFQILRDLLSENDCPTIVYVARTKKTELIASKLQESGFNAKPFHGQMEASVKTKNQQDFVDGKVKIMVATSAFGMGVDKSDVGMVVHYDISDSIENYMQEAGRAGRNLHTQAHCYILFNENDLNKHFTMLKQTKISQPEIQKVWKVIRDLTYKRKEIAHSPLEIARKAGWDIQPKLLETKVKAAISALETAGFVKRSENIPKIYATGIRVKNADEAVLKINQTYGISDKEKENAIRIIRNLIGSKYRKRNKDDAAEDRIDYISDKLGLTKEEVIRAVQFMREINILNDDKDLNIIIKRGAQTNQSIKVLHSMLNLEKLMIQQLQFGSQVVNLKKWNEEFQSNVKAKNFNISEFISILNFWAIKDVLKRERTGISSYSFHIHLLVHPNELEIQFNRRKDLSQFILKLLFDFSTTEHGNHDAHEQEKEVDFYFSILELQRKIQEKEGLFSFQVSIAEIEDTLLYLTRIEAIKIEGGFLVLYNRMKINRLKERDTSFTKSDYENLARFYENRTRQIHIVGAFATKLNTNYKEALQLAEDYFKLNNDSFLNKYFPNQKNELKRTLTKRKYEELFSSLSQKQKEIIDEKLKEHLVILAGPGSGKTKVLVHKLAALLLMDDVRQEHLLMLTFSRSAANEFRERLNKLLGQKPFVEINTFHGYCFNLLGKIGNIAESESVVKMAVEKIENREIEKSSITKTMLVIDEAQDMNQDEYDLVQALMKQNPEMKVMLVGDDDQAIFGFRNASPEFMRTFKNVHPNCKEFQLTENYRSGHEIVRFSQHYAEQFLKNRMKTEILSAQPNLESKVMLIKHRQPSFLPAFLQNILESPLSGVVGVLTHRNEDAQNICHLLNKNGFHARLINDNNEFKIWNVYEFRCFFEAFKSNKIIELDTWRAVFSDHQRLFAESQQWKKVERFLQYFFSNPSRHEIYLLDLETQAKELELDDFYDDEKVNYLVSTLHKSKGKEYDHVFLMFNHLIDPLNINEINRLLYVGLTRAKRQIFLHYHDTKLDILQAVANEFREESRIYPPLKEMVWQFKHKDLYLSNFIGKEEVAKSFVQGKNIDLYKSGILYQSKEFFKFSEAAVKHIATMTEKGYAIHSVRVYAQIYWKQSSQHVQENIQPVETLLVFPELIFSRIVN
jgi:ATP-dependent DNA helicase RecQ